MCERPRRASLLDLRLAGTDIDIKSKVKSQKPACRQAGQKFLKLGFNSEFWFTLIIKFNFIIT